MNDKKIIKIAEEFSLHVSIVKSIINEYIYTPYKDGLVLENTLKMVLEHLGLNKEDILNKSNKPHIVRAKRIYATAVVQYFKEMYGEDFIFIFRTLNRIPLYNAIAESINLSRFTIFHYVNYTADNYDAVRDMDIFYKWVEDNNLKIGDHEGL